MSLSLLIPSPLFCPSLDAACASASPCVCSCEAVGEKIGRQTRERITQQQRQSSEEAEEGKRGRESICRFIIPCKRGSIARLSKRGSQAAGSRDERETWLREESSRVEGRETDFNVGRREAQQQPLSSSFLLPPLLRCVTFAAELALLFRASVFRQDPVHGAAPIIDTQLELRGTQPLTSCLDGWRVSDATAAVLQGTLSLSRSPDESEKEIRGKIIH